MYTAVASAATKGWVGLDEVRFVSCSVWQCVAVCCSVQQSLQLCNNRCNTHCKKKSTVSGKHLTRMPTTATSCNTLQQSLQHALQAELERIRQTLNTDANHVSSAECIALFGEAASPAHPEGAVCCSVLQCFTVCCSMLQCRVQNVSLFLVKPRALRIPKVRCVAVCCSVLWCVAVCCSVECGMYRSVW